jgi:hypothetical protein
MNRKTNHRFYHHKKNIEQDAYHKSAVHTGQNGQVTVIVMGMIVFHFENVVM